MTINKMSHLIQLDVYPPTWLTPSESAPVPFQSSVPEPFSFRETHPLINSLTTFHQLNKCLPQTASSLTQFISTYHQSSSFLTHCHCGHSLSYPDSKQDSNWPGSPSPPLSSLSSPSNLFLPMLPNFFQSRNLIKMFPAQKLLWLSTTNLNLNCLAYHPGITVIWVPICSSSLIFH